MKRWYVLFLILLTAPVLVTVNVFWVPLIMAIASAASSAAAANQKKQAAKGMYWRTLPPGAGEQRGSKALQGILNSLLAENTGAPKDAVPTMSGIEAGQGKYGGLADAIAGQGGAYAPAASVQTGATRNTADSRAKLQNILAGDEARDRAIKYKLARKANVLGDEAYYNAMRSKALYEQSAMRGSANQDMMGAYGQLGAGLGYAWSQRTPAVTGDVSDQNVQYIPQPRV